MVRCLDSGAVPQRMGSAHPYERLTRAYPTRNGWLVVGLTARNWDKACQIWGRQDWLDDREMLDNLLMRAEEIAPAVDQILSQEDTEHWIAVLEPVGISCTPVNSMKEAVQLPPLYERNFIVETTNPEGRKLKIAGSPLHLSRTPGRVHRAAPLLAEHSEEALRDWLGLSEEAYRGYEDEGVFTQTDRALRGFW